LQSAGVRLRHLETGAGIPMYRTSRRCEPAGRFRGPVVVSMRAIAEAQLERTRAVTGTYMLLTDLRVADLAP